MAIESITVVAIGSPKLKKRAVQKAKENSLVEVCKFWDSRFKDIHFTTRGASRYHYTQRMTKSVTTGEIKKRDDGTRKAPSGLPLVWSRRSKTLSNSYKIRATSKMGKITYPIRAFNFKPPKANPRLDMRAEYTRVLPKEARKLESDGKRAIIKTFRGRRIRTTYRIT